MAQTINFNFWRAAAWGGSVLLLAIPAAMTRISPEWDWGPYDFAVFASLLGLLCLAFELTARASRNIAHLAAAALALATAFVIVWASLAVGIIGAEDNPANLVFVGVLAVGLVGGALVRLRSAGMARVMVVTAFAQAVAAIVAVVVGVPPEGVLTAAFIAPWLVSSWLFSLAAKQP